MLYYNFYILLTHIKDKINKTQRVACVQWKCSAGFGLVGGWVVFNGIFVDQLLCLSWDPNGPRRSFAIWGMGNYGLDFWMG